MTVKRKAMPGCDRLSIMWKLEKKKGSTTD
jgi:hypothetical protein